MALSAYKKPKTNDESNYVGIELEFSSPESRNKLTKIISAHKLTKYSQLGNDADPTKEGDEPYELKVLLKQEELKDVVPRIGQFFKDAQATVNTSCGMHVHLDMRNRSAKIAYNNLVQAQTLLFSIADKSRRNNRFCDTQLEPNLDQVSEDHYSAINPILATNKYTIEVRIREGLTNDEAIFLSPFAIPERLKIKLNLFLIYKKLSTLIKD